MAIFDDKHIQDKARLEICKICLNEYLQRLAELKEDKSNYEYNEYRKEYVRIHNNIKRYRKNIRELES